MKREYETFIDARKICHIDLENQQTLLRLIQTVIMKEIALISCMDRVKPNKINATDAIWKLENFFSGHIAKSVKNELWKEFPLEIVKKSRK